MRSRFDINLLPPAPTLEFEEDLWRQHFTAIAGLDEAGRGALAGPLFGAAVVLPIGNTDFLLKVLDGVRDSKEMTAAQREDAAKVIKATAVCWSVGVCTAGEIDALGMGPAGKLVFVRALEALNAHPDYLLIDYFRLPMVPTPQLALVKGDARSLSIACASIIAKTERDAWMRQLDRQYPAYRFSHNKGYGTPKHHEALNTCGTCPEHRMSFQLFGEQTT